MPGDRSGCPACLCKVTITEAPIPDKIRADLENGDRGGDEGGSIAAYKQFKNSLPLRPIPQRYTRLKSTPLEAEVSVENFEFEFDVER